MWWGGGSSNECYRPIDKDGASLYHYTIIRPHQVFRHLLPPFPTLQRLLVELPSTTLNTAAVTCTMNCAKPRSPTSLWTHARGCQSRQRHRGLVGAWWLCACDRSRSHLPALRERPPRFGFTFHRAIPLPPSPFYRSIPCTLPSGRLLLCCCVLHFLFCFVSFRLSTV